MPNYAIGKPGTVPRMVNCSEGDVGLNKGSGEVAVAVTVPPAGPIQINAQGSALVPVTQALTDLQKARWSDAVAFRTMKQEGGCATPSGRVDTDPDSQRKIIGAMAAAMASQISTKAFAKIGWTMSDNSVVSLAGSDVTAMGIAVVSFMNACQQASTVIRQQINAATDPAKLAAIDITAGYPA